MIKFYCKRCGKEMWQNVKWDAIKDLTLEEVKNSLLCSDCLLKEVKDIASINLIDTDK